MEIKKQIELMFKEKQTTVVLPTPQKVNRTGANYFVCRFEGCGATIKHRRNLVRHWQLHQKAKYYCFKCGYQSMNREQITQHHCCDPNSQSKFDCDECDKKFTVLQHLNRHLLLIHGVRLFVWCPMCRSYFARIDALKKHQSRCHQTDNIGSSLLATATTTSTTSNRTERGRSSIANISAIATSTITSASKNKNLLINNTDRINTSSINNQTTNGQIIVLPSNSRGENHHFTSNSANKQTSSILNLNSNALSNNQQTNIDENLFNKNPILIDNSTSGNSFVNNLALVRNSVISRGSASSNMITMDEQLQNSLNDNASCIKLINSNIILSNNNKVQQYISGVSNERDNSLYNLPIDAIDYNDYLYRNKKIRFGELIDKDRIFKN